ncbi:recombinase RecT [Pectinatus frisingensis]|uniref:recombinase RecT n=1 Tax=Pectinatus frisingensis TaxID=865 RepID=UPI0018C6D9D7|nr:recombinase RecT [Pectinatus frisingensis]
MENQLQTAEQSISERFTNSVLKEFGSHNGVIAATDYQKTLVQGYFIAIDRTLTATEAERIRKNESNKNHNYDNNLACTWSNVNMADLARDVMFYSKLGLDMLSDNNLFAIPFKNKKTKKYDLGFIKGYNGIKLIAERYAITPPKAVTIEVVYSSDKFSPIKKGHSNPFDTYEFNITNPFDRGEIVGGFGYVEYDDSAKNTLYCLNMKEINKRKPKYAAAEFWGGTKKDYKTNQDVEVEGWKDEMVYKTMIRHVYGKIALDPQKVDDAFRHIQQREADYRDMELKNEISANANKEPINITPDKPEEKPVPELAPEQMPHIEPPIQQPQACEQHAIAREF